MRIRGGYIDSLDFLSANQYAVKNKVIKLSYDFVKKFLPNAHYVETCPILIGDINHKWGIYGLHFLKQTYEYMYECVDYIIKNSILNNKLEEWEIKLFIVKKQSEYSKKIFEIYQKNVFATICKERNVINMEEGVAIGEYCKNGITLVVDSNYNFSVQGTASEDTCFYLYSYGKNPIGNWRSINKKLAVGKYLFTTKMKGKKDEYYIQLVLTDELGKKRWIGGIYSQWFEIKEECQYLLIRLIINKDVTIDDRCSISLEKMGKFA